MKINNCIISKEFSVAKKELKIIVVNANSKMEYNYEGEDVFDGDYWNTIKIGSLLFDVNFYKYPNFKLSIYPVVNNKVDYSISYQI
jgi:hypothetical protein